MHTERKTNALDKNAQKHWPCIPEKNKKVKRKNKWQKINRIIKYTTLNYRRQIEYAKTDAVWLAKKVWIFLQHLSFWHSVQWVVQNHSLYRRIWPNCPNLSTRDPLRRRFHGKRLQLQDRYFQAWIPRLLLSPSLIVWLLGWKSSSTRLQSRKNGLSGFLGPQQLPPGHVRRLKSCRRIWAKFQSEKSSERHIGVRRTQNASCRLNRV